MTKEDEFCKSLEEVRKELLDAPNSRTILGVSPLSLLGVAFIILKLCNVIAWSWLWVLAPFWIPIVLVLTIVLISTWIKTYCKDICDKLE